MTRLHSGGRFRLWLGERFGGDAELGDRLWRRLLHALGAFVLLYYPFPPLLFGLVPKLYLLIAALGLLLALEVLRHLSVVELPALRAYEHRRLASFVFYGVALVLAVVLLPLPIGAAVVLGTSLVDPLIGEVRASPRWRAGYPYVPYAVWVALALVGLVAWGGWPLLPSLGLALGAGALALAVERPKLAWMDDDLAMTFVPALLLYGVGVLVLGL